MSPRAVTYDAALSEAERLMAAANPGAAMAMLERAHVLGQREIGPHLRAMREQDVCVQRVERDTRQ